MDVLFSTVLRPISLPNSAVRIFEILNGIVTSVFDLIRTEYNYSKFSNTYRHQFLTFLPARRYAIAGNSDRNVSVRPSVCHAPVLCQNEES